MTEPSATTASNPFASTRFRIAIEGIPETGATEVILPEGRIVRTVRKPTATQYGNLIIRRGQTLSLDWYDWWNTARRAKRRPTRTIRISVDGADGVDGLSWTFTGATPVAYRSSPLNALGNEVLIETLELTVSHFEINRT